MHYSFIPVVKDKKTNIEKVSAKEVLNKRELQIFNDDLNKYMENVFGYDVGILNEATKKGNKSIKELKRGFAEQKMELIKQNVVKSQQVISDARVKDLKVLKNANL